MSTPLAIIGGGGFGRETLEIAHACNEAGAAWTLVGFIVEPAYAAAGDRIVDTVVLGGFDWLASHPETRVVCAIGQPEDRLAVVQKARAVGARFATLVHPSVRQTRSVRLGEGVIVNAGVVLTTNVELEDHAQAHVGALVSHDVKIGAFATVSPGARISGNVHVGDGAYLGTGATVIQRLRVGAWSIVGAGCVVTRDVPDNSTFVGVPGRAIKFREDGWQYR